jgi:spoIIIJ-associated protein
MPAQPKEILTNLLQKLGFECTVDEESYDDGVMLDVKTDDAGRLIGRAGQTLADLQYLVNRIAFKLDENAPKVTVDVGGYRAEEREKLIKRAHEGAEKVRRWGDVIELEPMNAYDRRIVHHALKDDPDITTQSVEVDGTTKKAILLRPRGT